MSALERTRDCVDPWSMALVRTDGSVALCCWGDPVGRVGEAPLGEILRGERASAVRAGLLRGDPGEDCRRCPARAWTTPARLRERLVTRQRDERERRELRAHAAELAAELGRWKAHAAELQRERDGFAAALASGWTGAWRRATAPAKRALRRVLGSRDGRREA